MSASRLENFWYCWILSYFSAVILSVFTTTSTVFKDVAFKTKLTQADNAKVLSAGWQTGAPSLTPPPSLSASPAVHGTLRNYKFTWPCVCVCVCVCEISRIAATVFRESVIWWQSKNYTQGTTNVRPSYSHAVLGGEGEGGGHFWGIFRWQLYENVAWFCGCTVIWTHSLYSLKKSQRGL